MTEVLEAFLVRPWAEALRAAVRATMMERLRPVEPISVGLLLAYGGSVTAPGWRRIDPDDMRMARRLFRRAVRSSVEGVRRLHIWVTEERWDALLARGVAVAWGSAVRDGEGRHARRVPWGLELIEHVARRRREDTAIQAIWSLTRVAALPPEHSERRAAMEDLREMTCRSGALARLVAHAGLIDAAARVGRNREAVRLADRAVLLKPESGCVLRLSGHMHARAGDTEGALRAFQRAVTVMGRDPHNHLALARIQVERGDLDHAMRTLDRVVASGADGEVQRARIESERDLLRAGVAQTVGRAEEAHRLLKTAVRTLPSIANRKDVSELMERLGVRARPDSPFWSAEMRPGTGAQWNRVLPVRARRNVASSAPRGLAPDEPTLRSPPPIPERRILTGNALRTPDTAPEESRPRVGGVGESRPDQKAIANVDPALAQAGLSRHDGGQAGSVGPPRLAPRTRDHGRDER